jgi:mono/diheme cytochrome c family protein
MPMTRLLRPAATRALLIAGLGCGLGVVVAAHNIGSTPVTWNREISRLVYDKCASCHRPGGGAFSMMTYADVQPRVVEIKTAVLSRTMPPWGAIKGFGQFRNDQALTQEQIELIVDWIQNDAPRGNNRRALPREPKFSATPPYQLPPRTTGVTGTTTLSQPVILDGLMPDRVPSGRSMRITASLPNGSVEPLVWLHQYDNRYRHPFLFRKSIRLPAGTVIRGVPDDAVVNLIPH